VEDLRKNLFASIALILTTNIRPGKARKGEQPGLRSCSRRSFVGVERTSREGNRWPRCTCSLGQAWL